MKVICRGRRNGKTIEAIKESAKTGSYIVCLNQKECHRVAKVAQDMGLDISFPITFDELSRGQYYAHGGCGIKGFIIDNADMLLQRLTAVPINLITLTNDNEG